MAFEGWMVGKPCSFQPHSRGMTRYFCEILASVRAGLVVAKRWSIGRRHASSLLGRKSRNPFQPLPTWTQSVGTLFRPPLLRKRSYFPPKSLQTLNLKNLKRFTIFSFEVVILSFCISCRFCTNKILKGPFDYLSMFQLRDATKSDEFSEKFQRCGAGGSFSIQKFILQILNLSKGLFLDVFRKKLQYNFLKMRGGSKAVWNFPENSSDLSAWPVPSLHMTFLLALLT